MTFWNSLVKRFSTFKTRLGVKGKTLLGDRSAMIRWALAINVAGLAYVFYQSRDNFDVMMTKQVQHMAQTQIPVFMRKFVYESYARRYGVNLEEVQYSLNQYPTLSAFFTRRINRQLQPQLPNTLCSPCDGKILSYEEVTSNKCNTIKGNTYSLNQLLLGEVQLPDIEPIHTYLRKNQKTKLYQVIIYLAPGDYHRFHSPTQMKVLKQKQFDGQCNAVNEKNISSGKKIYEKNARVCLFSQWQQGALAMVMVGALNVSRIYLANKTVFKRGDEVGYFNLGSTIVMLFETKGVKQWKIKQGAKVKYGQALLEHLV